MKITAYAVRLGNKLYIQSDVYTVWQATTENILNAKWYTNFDKASKIAKKNHGEIVPIYVSDEDVDVEINVLRVKNQQLESKVQQLEFERDQARHALMQYKKMLDEGVKND